MTALTVTTSAIASGTAIVVTGDLDFHTAPQVRTVLSALALAPGQQLLIDLTGLDYCDSSGITAMIAARNLALAADATIAMIGIPDRVRRIFDLSGLKQLFPAYPTVEAAEDAWRLSPS